MHFEGFLDIRVKLQNLKLMNSLIWSSLLRVLNMIRSGRWLESSVITMEVRGETDSPVYQGIETQTALPGAGEIRYGNIAEIGNYRKG